MSSEVCVLYVLRLKPEGYYYIGITLRPFKMRLQEHKGGFGSKWSSKHGFHSVVEEQVIPIHEASYREDQKTIEYMRKYGWQGVRGGDYTNSKEAGSTWWLPAEFQPGGSTYGLYPASINTAFAFPRCDPSLAATRVLCPGP